MTFIISFFLHASWTRFVAERAVARPLVETALLLSIGAFLLHHAAAGQKQEERATAFDHHFFERLAKEKIDLRIVIGGALVMAAPLRLCAVWL